ncbi:hypothetical protein R3P38DRAFT_69396 [Favolaschia claudopus]|uniref:Uncharacterized protein n=1 Tax=Favolaschia claudopus TaxID=2862362 RepID=A0AAW0D5H8_9AGAR
MAEAPQAAAPLWPLHSSSPHAVPFTSIQYWMIPTHHACRHRTPCPYGHQAAPSSPLPNQYIHHSRCGWCDLWRSLQAVSRVFGGVLKHKVGSGGAQRIDESFAGTALSNRSSRVVTRPNPGTVRGRAAVFHRVDLSSGDFIVATRSPPCPRSSSSRSSSNLSAFTRQAFSFLLPISGQRQPRSPWARFFAKWDGAHAHCKGTTCDSVGVLVDTGDFYLGRGNSTQVPQGFNRRSRHSNGRPVFTDCQRLV